MLLCIKWPNPSYRDFPVRQGERGMRGSFASKRTGSVATRANEEQTASLQAALLRRFRCLARAQMRTAQRGSIPVTWSSALDATKGLVELARCRSDLFSASWDFGLRREGCGEAFRPSRPWVEA